MFISNIHPEELQWVIAWANIPVSSATVKPDVLIKPPFDSVKPVYCDIL